MQLRYFFLTVVMLVALFVDVAKGQLFEGDDCVLENGDLGLCKPSEDCPGMINLISSGGGKRRRPIICSFNNLNPVICCKNTQNHQPSNTQKTPTPTANIVDDIQVPSATEVGTDDACTLPNGLPGECTSIIECPRVRDMIKEGNGINTTICRFDDINTPIFCCPLNNPALSATPPHMPRNPSNNDQHRTGPPPFRNPALPTPSVAGAKSASMCEYYSQFVFQVLEAPTLNIIPDYYNESQCNSREYKANQAPLRDVEEALYKEFPHLAALGYGNETHIKWLCTGSLISERFILTSAHCLRSPNNGNVRWVDIGNLKPSVTSADTRKPFVVSELIRHEGYRESMPGRNDIALLKLQSDVDVTPHGGRSRPACLYTQPGNPARYKFATAIGWGRTAWDDTNTTVHLMKKDLTFVPEDQCTASNQMSRRTNSSRICMSDPHPEVSSCVGDSGGPLQIILETPYCMQAIVGITSYGPRACAGDSRSAVYTRVSDYISWIEDHVWP